MCVYIYIYIYIYICTHTYTHICIHAYTHTYTLCSLSLSLALCPSLRGRRMGGLNVGAAPSRSLRSERACLGLRAMGASLRDPAV